MDDFLHRKPKKVEGYPDELQNVFEDLIDAFVPLENIRGIIEGDYGIKGDQLDSFCKEVYGRSARDAYEYLHLKSDSYARKAVTQLALGGNKTAMSCLIDYFAGWSENKKNEGLKVTIVADVPKEEK